MISDLAQLASRLADASTSDAEVIALNEEIAAIADAIMSRPISRTNDLIRKLEVLRIPADGQWDALIPRYVDIIETDARLLHITAVGRLHLTSRLSRKTQSPSAPSGLDDCEG